MSAVEPLPNTFGPSLATPANAITVIRLLLAPIAFGLIVDRPVSWLTWAVWAALACSDGLDAGRPPPAATTRSRRALDPLADKVLILGGMVALSRSGGSGPCRWRSSPSGRSSSACTARTGAGGGSLFRPAGRPRPRRSPGPVVGFAVWPPTAEHVDWLADVMLWVSVALALVSAGQYLAAGRQAHSAAVRSKFEPFRGRLVGWCRRRAGFWTECPDAL